MSIHLGKAKRLIEKIKKEKDLNTIKIIVGGYPFIEMPEMSKNIGADGLAQNGPDAVRFANNLLTADYVL